MSFTNYKDYCPEHYMEIENYDLAAADNFKGWICHHRKGEEGYSADDLKKMGLYFNRPPCELKFVTRHEHGIIHGTGKTKSSDVKQKISDTKCAQYLHHSELWREEHSKRMTGEGNPMHGKHHTDETRKKMSNFRKGKKWFTDGKTNVCSETCPAGYRPGITRKG